MPTLRTGSSSSTNLATAVAGYTTGDTVIIEGATHYTAGEDLSGVELNKVIIREDAKLFGGGTSAVFDLSGASDELHMESSQPCYISAGGSGGEIQTLVVTHAPRGLTVTGGTIPDLEQADGDTFFTSSVDVQDISISGGSCRVDTHASHTIDNIEAYGTGTYVNIQRSVGTKATIGQGTRFVTADRTLTIADLQLYGHFEDNCGTITTATFYPGSTIDLSKLEADKTYSALTVWPNVRVVGKVPTGVTVTWPTPTMKNGGSDGPWS